MCARYTMRSESMQGPKYTGLTGLDKEPKFHSQDDEKIPKIFSLRITQFYMLLGNWTMRRRKTSQVASEVYKTSDGNMLDHGLRWT